jgi:hypothetical protein
MRGKADMVWMNEEGDRWNELYAAFSEADTASVRIAPEAGRLMFWVWTAHWAWRDESTRVQIKDELRPQWRKQMYELATSR